MAGQPSRVHDLACVIHLHSTYSDGTGTVAQIANAARQSSVDVVFLTDHDSLAARRAGKEGWYGRTLVLAGEEVSPLGRDHYLAFGIEHEIDHRGMSAGAICDAVRAAGGFGFAAHPWSRGSKRFGPLIRAMPWSETDHPQLEGVELWSFVTDTAEQLSGVWEALRFIVSPRRQLTDPPRHNISEWERMCRNRRVVAIAGVDAHQFGLRIAGRVPLRLMGYKRSFSHLRTHLLLPTPPTGDLETDRQLTFGSLREGSCYLAVDSIADPTGFNFFAESTDSRAAMGTEHSAGSGWTLIAQVPKAALIRLLCDGAELERAHATRLEYATSQPGVYRVEVLSQTLGRSRTWIISNPIYLR